METNKERKLLPPTRHIEPMDLRHHPLDLRPNHCCGHGTAHSWQRTAYCVAARSLHACSCNPVLHRWKSVRHHYVQHHRKKSAFPNQLDTERRRCVSWSLLPHRRYCGRQCECRKALPRGVGCTIQCKSKIQKDDQDSISFLVHSVHNHCYRLYCGCRHPPSPNGRGIRHW